MPALIYIHTSQVNENCFDKTRLQINFNNVLKIIMFNCLERPLEDIQTKEY